MKYQILKEFTTLNTAAVQNLEKKVNIAISKGWKPIGGVSVYNGFACQAMIKEERR